MIDTIRLSISDLDFYYAVKQWRQEDLNGVIPARINVDVLRQLIEEDKVIDLRQVKEGKRKNIIDALNEYGLDLVFKDFFQLYSQGSWSRDITMVIDSINRCIIVEASLPKFFHGQNVDLIYDYKTCIYDFIGYLFCYFGLEPPKLSRIEKVKVSRVDICCYYMERSQIHALDFIRSFRSWFKHKRKKMHFYETSVMFVGRSYSLKFYLKKPEFISHDKADILKNLGSLIDYSGKDERKEIKQFYDLIDYCENKADGMIRAEFTLRKAKLEYDGIFTVKDLCEIDIIEYYEKLLARLGVIQMGRTKKEEYFNQLKSDKKLLQYAALLETFGLDKVKEVYHRTTIAKYNRMLSDMDISLNDFDIIRSMSLAVGKEHVNMVAASEEKFGIARKFANGSLF